MRWACCSCANRTSRSSFMLRTKPELRSYGLTARSRGSAESNGVACLRNFNLWTPAWHSERLNCPTVLHFNFAMTHPAELHYLRQVLAIGLSNCTTQFIHLIL